MNRYLAAVAAAIIVMTGPALSGAAAPAAAGEIRFVVLGDSIAHGHYGTNDRENKSYAAIVSRANHYTLENLAVNGDRTEDLLALLESDETVREAVRGADLINISIGGNDFLQHRLGLYELLTEVWNADFTHVDRIIADCRENFGEIVELVRTLNGGAVILMQTLYNPHAHLSLTASAFQTVVDRINGVFTNYLDERPGAYTLADVAAAFAGGSGLVSADTIHPSVAGHQVIAGVLLDALETLDFPVGAAPAATPPATAPETTLPPETAPKTEPAPETTGGPEAAGMSTQTAVIAAAIALAVLCAGGGAGAWLWKRRARS